MPLPNCKRGGRADSPPISPLRGQLLPREKPSLNLLRRHNARAIRLLGGRYDDLLRCLRGVILVVLFVRHFAQIRPQLLALFLCAVGAKFIKHSQTLLYNSV